jgi:hypothetical protein
VDEIWVARKKTREDKTATGFEGSSGINSVQLNDEIFGSAAHLTVRQASLLLRPREARWRRICRAFSGVIELFQSCYHEEN